MTRKQGRYFREKPTALKGTPYDSMTEKRLHEGVLSVASFHPDKIEYEIPHRYEPDFEYTDSDGLTWLIEVKAIFNDSAEASKYQWIAKALPDNKSLVFVFERPDSPIHWQRKRKDGSKMTYREWANKNGFMVFTEDDIGNLLK